MNCPCNGGFLKHTDDLLSISSLFQDERGWFNQPLFSSARHDASAEEVRVRRYLAEGRRQQGKGISHFLFFEIARSNIRSDPMTFHEERRVIEDPQVGLVLKSLISPQIP